MRKFPDSVAALVRDGTVAADEVIDPGFVADEDLLRVHTPAYVRSIKP